MDERFGSFTEMKKRFFFKERQERTKNKGF